MNAVIAGSPRLSPDGKWLAFDSRPANAQSDIYVMPSKRGPVKQLTDNRALDTVPTWPGNGTYIYFQSNRNGAAQVWKMRADGRSGAN